MDRPRVTLGRGLKPDARLASRSEEHDRCLAVDLLYGIEERAGHGRLARASASRDHAAACANGARQTLGLLRTGRTLVGRRLLRSVAEDVVDEPIDFSSGVSCVFATIRVIRLRMRSSSSASALVATMRTPFASPSHNVCS